MSMPCIKAGDSEPVVHKQRGSYGRAPGMTLPPVAYSEGRNQPASSSYDNHNASRDADVYPILAPSPGPYQDDDTGPSLKNLVMTVVAVKSAVNHFAKMLISDMNKRPEDLKHLKQRIRHEVQGDVDRANHWKFLVQAFVCQCMFDGFESRNGFFGIEHFDGLKMMSSNSFADFTRYEDIAATISELCARSSRDRSFLGRYCFKKFKAICVDPATHHSLAIYQQEWSWVEEERHPQGEFYQSFLKVAVSVWLLHRLVHSFEQGWSMLGWETYPKGNKFQKKTMESVVPGGYEEEDEETGTDVKTVVGFLVIPGFQVSKSVVKCEVYLRNKNNLTDGKITEARVKSLEKSFSDKTPANSLTPPPKSSMDKSPGSRPSLWVPSNYSGHSSSRVAENVQSSSMFWINNIDHSRSAKSKSVHFDTPRQSQTQSMFLPTSMPIPTARVAPQYVVRSTVSSRLREENAARLKEEIAARLKEAEVARLKASHHKAYSFLKDVEGSAEAIQKNFDLLKFNIEQCKYLRDKLCVVIQSADSFLELSRSRLVGSTSNIDNSDLVKIFELLMVLGKQIESFVESCCEDAWVQAAMAFTNALEYVSSLSFNLELCRVTFGKDNISHGCLTMDEVDSINKSEAELVGKKAYLDARLLIEKVVLALNTLHGEDRDLASYLLQRLLGIKPSPSSANETGSSNLFAWVDRGVQVGRGASATIYKTMWFGISVAKKTFRGSENPNFEKEVQTLSRLCHPNITSMFCCAKNKRNCSIIMELMDGDLDQLMEKRCKGSYDSPPFPILEAVDIMLQIGEGVNYLHNQGIVHRDLKSRNILYRNVKVKNVEIGYVHVKVADFGISKARDITDTTYSDLTRNTGTNRWMPPEIIGSTHENEGDLASTGEKLPKYPFKLDSYSFGLVCYEILVGHEPFLDCKNANEIKEKILNNERPILPCESSKCPLMLKTLIEKCWSQDPKDRPTFSVICKELKYLKYLLLTDQSMARASTQYSTSKVPSS